MKRFTYKSKNGTIYAVRPNESGKYRACHRVCRAGKLSENWTPLVSLWPRKTEEEAQEDLDRYADRYGIRFESIEE